MSDEDIDENIDEDIDEDIDDELDEGEEEPGGHKFGWKKILLFAGLPVLLLIGGVTGAYFAGLMDPILGDEQQAEDTAALAAGNVAMYDLPEMLVNLTADGGSTYLKINVSLEIEDPTIAPQLDALLPSIVENFQVYLRELQLDDLDGSAGLYRLKEELLVRVITAVQPLQINDVLFREMVVQ